MNLKGDKNSLKILSFAHARLKILLSDTSYKRAENLFKEGAVRNLEFFSNTVCADIVSGPNTYSTCISLKDFFKSSCDCYAGQEGKYCKHLVALGLSVISELNIKDDDTRVDNLSDFKKLIKSATALIKPYNGPSRIWFEYQMKLELASFVIKEALESLPASKETAKYLWKLVLRLSKKMSHGGVDDSDGFVGDAIYAIMDKIVEFAKSDKDILKLTQSFTDYTGFDFENHLQKEITKVC